MQSRIFARRIPSALILGSPPLIAHASAQAALAQGFVEDSSCDTEHAISYFNRDFREGAGPIQRENGPRALSCTSSPVTPPGTIGFGLDAPGDASGVKKLDSAPNRTRHRLLPTHDDGRAADENYSKLNLTAKGPAYRSPKLLVGSLLPKLPTPETRNTAAFCPNL